MKRTLAGVVIGLAICCLPPAGFVGRLLQAGWVSAYVARPDCPTYSACRMTSTPAMTWGDMAAERSEMEGMEPSGSG